MKRFSRLLIWVLVLSTLAFAHGGMEHILGTVVKITGHSFSVKTNEGSITTVDFDGQTQFVKGDAPATVKDIEVGSRVVIHAQKHDNSLYPRKSRSGRTPRAGRTGTDDQHGSKILAGSVWLLEGHGFSRANESRRNEGFIP
ncbi:MAG TPA: hypothetical protein VN868_11815 [Terriglobales bacterium]|nr:hypothetical protein [Terriglobales bacterium]